MSPLRETPKLALAVPAFRLVAHLEALSWVGLLSGMWLKYLVANQVALGTELVSVFGAVHGALVMAYVALAGILAVRLRWAPRTIGLAVLATIPPFATLLFDWYASRRRAYESAGDLAQSTHWLAQPVES